MWPPETDDSPPARPAPGSRALTLTRMRIESLPARAKVYELPDPGCAGLKLRVAPSGTKVWTYRFYCRRRRQTLQIGVWPEMDLALARERMVAARHVVRQGQNPRDAGIVPASARRARRRYPKQRLPTSHVRPVVNPRRPPLETDLSADPSDVPSNPLSFAYLAHEFYHRHIVKERGYLRPLPMKELLNRDVLPYWAWRDSRSIQSREIIWLLDRIVARGAKTTANRVGRTLGHLFRYAVHRQIVAETPVKLLYQPGGLERARERVFSETELKTFLLNHKALGCAPRMAHVFMVMLLTLQRRQELAWAHERDFDLEAGTWVIPDEHAKGKVGHRRGHVVPLSDWAIEEIRALMALSGRSGYLLPRKDRAGPIDPALISRTVRRLRPRFKELGIQPWTPHDLRRTARTGLAELGVDDNIAERVINHRLEPMKRVYNRYARFPQLGTAQFPELRTT